VREVLRLLLSGVISAVALLIVVLLVSAVLRRIVHGTRYRRLDRQRPLYRKELEGLLVSGAISRRLYFFRARPWSVKWLAVEDALLDLMDDGSFRDAARRLFDELGYVACYEGRLRSSNAITRASAIDKLGRMRSAASVGRLLGMLDSGSAETTAVTIRALSRIGSFDALEGILKRLPGIVDRSLATQKTITAFLINFGPPAVPLLMELAERQLNPAISAIVLEVLSQLRSKKALPLAVMGLDDESPEVRAKALKLLGRTVPEESDLNWKRVREMLDDKVWFVRLHAARAVGSKKYEEAVPNLVKLLADDSWRVRNAAATALTNMGDTALDAFLEVLRSDDPYVKGSVCEEIQKTGYVSRLIRNLDDGEERNARKKSREILQTMCEMNFRSPFHLYLERGESEELKTKIREILAAPQEAP
jgi:HEAT repeat protein